MTDIKVRARLIMKGKVLSLWIKGLLPSVLAVSALLCAVIPVLFLFYGAASVLPFVSTEEAYLIVVLLTGVSLFLFVFSLVRKCYSEAAVFFLLDKNGTAPASYYKFSQGLRYCRMRLMLMLYRFCWGSVFMFPSLFLFYVLFSGVYNGTMIKSIFVTLLIAGILFFITGVLFTYTVSARYFLCDYLFYLYPLSPVRSLISSSSLLCRRKLICISLCRICIFPWKLFGIFGATLPFSRVFVKCIRAVLSENIYGERKCSRKKPAVVFYIGKNSVFVPSDKGRISPF